MNARFTIKTAVSLRQIALILCLSVTPVFLALWLMTGSPTQAGGFSCGAANTTTWTVNNDEAYLNFVIGSCLGPLSTAGTYTVALTQDINLSHSTTTIDNNRAGIAIVIEGNNFIVSGQNISDTRPFNIAADTHVTLQNITITEGNAGTEWGGGIYNNGTLTLTNSLISQSVADSGGGIANYSAGTLTVINSTISNNANSNFGGGIYNYYGTVTLNKSQIISNSALSVGGGIYNTGGTLTLTDSTLSNNSADNIGGIYNSGTLTMTNSTLSGNSAGQSGGIHNTGTVTISNSTLKDNWTTNLSGGAIINEGTLALIASTLSNNSAADTSGGIFNYGTGVITITNSTLSGNSAIGRAGGILNAATLTVINSTFSGNSSGEVNGGGGLLNYATLSLSNTIIANSPSGGDCANFTASNVDDGHNLVEDSGCGITGGSDPLLGPLQDNGGPTFTHALLFGSPAVNQGDTTLTTDQRGFTRPASGTDDIGAFELVFSNLFLPLITR